MGRKLIETFESYIAQGGFIMLPLVVATLVLWYALGYRYLTLQRGTSSSIYKLLEQYGTGKSRAPRGIVDRACQLGARVFQAHRAPIRALLDDALSQTTKELRRGRSIIGSVVAIAPLLGLLGTVTGMIETFDSLADMSFYSQSGGIAGGISEALFTTQMGLVVAVPGVIIGRLLDRRQGQLEEELEHIKNYLCAEDAERRTAELQG